MPKPNDPFFLQSEDEQNDVLSDDGTIEIDTQDDQGESTTMKKAAGR